MPWGQPELGPGNTPCSTKTAGQVETQPKHQAADPLGHLSQRKGAKQLCWEGGVFLAQNMPRDLQRPELAKTSSNMLLPGQSLRIPSHRCGVRPGPPIAIEGRPRPGPSWNIPPVLGTLPPQGWKNSGADPERSY